MVKYTHITERCSGFLKTGVALRLKRHSYTFADAYWRLREGKGLISAGDQIALAIWRGLITDIRRQTGAPMKLSPVQDTSLKQLRKELLERMEAYRDRLECGMRPEYLYDDSHPLIVENVLAEMIYKHGNPVEWTADEQTGIWETLDIQALKANVEEETCKWHAYIKGYERLTEAEKEKAPTPEEWVRNRYYGTLKKDKMWMIRAGHDQRSSIEAGINDRLLLIWDIPSISHTAHKDIYRSNRQAIDDYLEWKNKFGKPGMSVNSDQVFERVKKVLGSIQVPE